MTLFNQAIYSLGAKVYDVIVINKETSVQSIIKVYGILINMPTKNMNNRKDLVSEGYTSSFYTQTYLNDSVNKCYVLDSGKYYFASLQGNLSQKPLNQTLNHYEYICREANDDLENITS